jgi:membrane-bound lytic murein transglycosylase D
MRFEVLAMNSVARRRFLTVAVLTPVAALAQISQFKLEDLTDEVDQLIRKHLDPRAVESFRRNLDMNQVRSLLQDLQEQFQGEYVLDLAQVRDSARTLLPILESLPQTRSYAGWLRPRMDYFDVADQLSVEVPAPRAQPGKPPPPRPNPTPVQERRAWTVQVAKTPVSRGSATWVPRLKPIFSTARVPSELVWLAEIESSFNPEAQSPAGAVGLYQLMPATAQSLGLKLQPQDERRNGDRNARAAAAYLRSLNLKFREWRLTLAAYNAGEGRVRQTLKTTRGKTFDDIARHLPAETQMYVPKFEAVLKRHEGRILNQLPAVPAA